MSVIRNVPSWRERALRRVDDLQARAAALKEGPGFCGCGFSHELAGHLAATRRQIMECNGAEKLWLPLIASVRLESDAETISLAEQCQRGNCRHRRWSGLVEYACGSRHHKRRLKRTITGSMRNSYAT
jgi:hypothetical protein